MKKFLRIFIVIIIVLACFFQINIQSTDAKASDTLGDLKNQLKELQAKQSAQKNKQKLTKEQIAANKEKMTKASIELEETKQTISELSNKIDKSNEEIKTVEEESKDLLILYQKLQSENVYASYVTGASSMTELIMRLDAINQLSNFNEQKIDELEMLIKTNEKLNKELDEYQVELDKRIVEYEKANEDLQDDLDALELGSVTIDQEVTALKETIASYEKLGCKDDQLLSACVNVSDNKGWLKPIPKAMITSTYGYRQGSAIVSSYHRGVDMSAKEKTPVYATAAGTVGAIVRKSSCGGNMVYIWAYVNGKPYTYVFMHLYQIDVSVGDTVNVNTKIGLSGGGSTAKKNGGYDGCTTGAHLHYGLATGGFYGTKALPLSKFNSNTINPPGYPGLYQWFYSR